MSGCSVYDLSTGLLLLQLTGLRFNKLDTGLDSHSGHTYTRSKWKPDITFYSQDQFQSSTADASTTQINEVIDLAAHKKPTLKVMEANLSSTDGSSLWFQGGNASSRAAYSQYHFASPDANTLINVQGEYESLRNTTFSLLDLTKPSFNFSEKDFDLVVFKGLLPSSEETIAHLALNVHDLLSEHGHALFVQQDPASTSPVTDYVLVEDTKEYIHRATLTSILEANGFRNILEVPCNRDGLACLSVAESRVSDLPSFSSSVSLIYLSEDTKVNPSVKSDLQQYGWQITEHHHPFVSVQPKSTVLIMDELSSRYSQQLSKTSGRRSSISSAKSAGCYGSPQVLNLRSLTQTMHSSIDSSGPFVLKTLA